MNQLIQVQTTCGSEKEAKDLSLVIIKEKLGACVQVEPVSSYYMWEGKPQEELEWRMTIKTQRKHYQHLEAFISEHHSYKTPQIISLGILDTSAEYRQWLEEQTEK